MTDRLRIPFFLLRLSIAVFLLQWTIEKFVRPEHTRDIFKWMYNLQIDPAWAPIMGAVELVIVLSFLAGFQKRISYALVFVMHFISVSSTWEIMLHPYTSPVPGRNLYMTAVPVLVAMGMLYRLRDLDSLWSVDAWRAARSANAA